MPAVCMSTLCMEVPYSIEMRQSASAVGLQISKHATPPVTLPADSNALLCRDWAHGILAKRSYYAPQPDFGDVYSPLEIILVT